jgi:hypothetical protein
MDVLFGNISLMMVDGIGGHKRFMHEWNEDEEGKEELLRIS